jgi:hypothetical protein
MTTAQRWWLVLVLCGGAAGVAANFLEYRWAYSGERPGEIVLEIAGNRRLSDSGCQSVLAQVSHEVPLYADDDWWRKRGEAEARRADDQHKFCNGGLYGVYGRDYPRDKALVGGVLVPFLLLAAAGYLALGRSRRTI